MIKKIIKKILIYLELVEKTNPLTYLLRNKIIDVGENCDISELDVLIVGQPKIKPSIRIGNNCCVKGKIIIYTSEGKITIGDNVYIGPNTVLECYKSIDIGNHVLISTNCNIIDTNSHSMVSSERMNDTIDWQQGLHMKNWTNVVSKSIIIKDNCWIGLRSIILKGVILNEGTVVAAGSVVSRNSESFSLLAGNPAKIIKTLN